MLGIPNTPHTPINHIWISGCIVELLKAILFDLDGTLTRFQINYIAAAEEAVRILRKYGLKDIDLAGGTSIYLALKQAKPRLKKEDYEKLKQEMYRLLEEVEVKAAAKVQPNPKVKEVLTSIKQMGVKLGLVSNNGRASVELSLKRMQLKELFDAITTRDDCEELKPDTGGIKKTLEELGVGVEEAVFVGDGVYDVAAAKALGVVSIAVPTGQSSIRRLVEAQPDYLINSIQNLPDLLKTLEKP